MGVGRSVRICVAGHLCLDLTPKLTGDERITPGLLEEIGSLSVRLGGTVANTGGDLAHLGVPVRIAAAVGDDALGALLREAITARAGWTGQLRTVPSATSYTLVFETSTADRAFWHHVGSNGHFDGTQLSDADLSDLDLLHLGYPNLLPAIVTEGGAPLSSLLRRARAAGVTTSLDLAVVHQKPEHQKSEADGGAEHVDWPGVLRRSVAETDVISPSVDDLTSALRLTDPVDDELVERLAERLLGWGAAVVAVSAGVRGMFWCTADAARLASAGRGIADAAAWSDQRGWVRPFQVPQVVTTTGAGDAASAGLLYGLVRGLPPATAAELAMARSAAVVSGAPTTPASVATFAPRLTALLT